MKALLSGGILATLNEDLKLWDVRCYPHQHVLLKAKTEIDITSLFICICLMYTAVLQGLYPYVQMQVIL